LQGGETRAAIAAIFVRNTFDSIPDVHGTGCFRVVLDLVQATASIADTI
jgi:hypothetical protein